MIRTLKDLSRKLAPNASLEMPIRLFQLICLAVTALTLFVILPVNLFQNLPILVNIGDVLLGLFSFFCFWESTRGRHHQFLFLIFMVLLMEPIWFLNSGTDGSITLYFLVVIVYPIVMFRGKKRWTLTVCMILNICALLAIDYFLPSLTVPFRSQGDRVIDLISGAFCSCLGLVMIIWVVVSNYDKERERTEKYARDLAVTHHRLETTVAAIPDLMFELDANAHIFDFHAPAAELLYVPPEAFLGKTVDQVLPPDASAVILNALERAARTGIDRGASYALDRHGSRCWYELSIAKKHSGSTLDARFVALVRDITERKRAEEALRTSEERFRQVAETVSDFVWEVDADGLYTYTSPSVEKILGYTSDELVGKVHFYDLFVPDVREQLKTAAFEVFETKQRFQAFPNDNISKSGRIVYLETSGVPILDEAGHLLGYRGADTDITDRRLAEMETQLIRQELALFSRVATVGELTTSIAHELSQPLAAILSNAQAALRLMQVEAPDLKELREILKDIVADDQRAGDVIRNMRSMLKRDVGERYPLSINSLITNIVSIVRNDALMKKVSVVLDLGSPMPPVEGNRIQLQQVILNLVVNAFDAMEDSEKPRKLLLRTRQADGEIMVDVVDSGSGIPADKLNSILEPFYTTKANGMGMGLSIARRIIEAHEGRIWGENDPSGGATFRIALPVSGKGEVADQQN
jgi:PAS domain S-box-containing protein